MVKYGDVFQQILQHLKERQSLGRRLPAVPESMERQQHDHVSRDDEFAVSGAWDEYIDLANTYLLVEAQIVADDHTALDVGADITQLWSSCQRISINGGHVVQGYTWTSI